MCLNVLRLQSYKHVLGQAVAVAGVRSLWSVNLQHAPTVRSQAIAGRLDRLSCLIAAAKVHASRAGLREAAEALKVKERELKSLAAELAVHQLPTADVTVLDRDWGKPGRGAKILAWIAATGATADQVMDRFQLARSTAQGYVRKAKRAATVAA